MKSGNGRSSRALRVYCVTLAATLLLLTSLPASSDPLRPVTVESALGASSRSRVQSYVLQEQAAQPGLIVHPTAPTKGGSSRRGVSAWHV